jgi:hypothetical protein
MTTIESPLRCARPGPQVPDAMPISIARQVRKWQVRESEVRECVLVYNTREYLASHALIGRITSDKAVAITPLASGAFTPPHASASGFGLQAFRPSGSSLLYNFIINGWRVGQLLIKMLIPHRLLLQPRRPTGYPNGARLALHRCPRRQNAALTAYDTLSSFQLNRKNRVSNMVVVRSGFSQGINW